MPYAVDLVRLVTSAIFAKRGLSLDLRADGSTACGCWIYSGVYADEVLQHYYHNEWVHLVALDPESGVWYRYHPKGVWNVIP